MASDMVDHQTSYPGVIIMPPACLPVMQFAIVSVRRNVLLSCKTPVGLCVHLRDFVLCGYFGLLTVAAETWK